MSPADGERRLNSAIGASPGAASASWKRPITTTLPAWGISKCAETVPTSCRRAFLRERDELVEPRSSRARVDRLRGDGDSLAKVGRAPGGRDRARGVEQDR